MKILEKNLELKIVGLFFVLVLAVFVLWYFRQDAANLQTASLNVPINFSDRNFACNPDSKWHDRIWCKEYGGSFDRHKIEAARHQGVVVIYRVESGKDAYFITNPDGEKIYDKKSRLYSNSPVHCSKGALLNYHASSHLKFSPSRRGMYDGDGHYWCELNGVAMNPLSGR